MSAHSVTNVVPIFKEPAAVPLTNEGRTSFIAGAIAELLSELDRGNKGLPMAPLHSLTPFERQDYERRAIAVCRSFDERVQAHATDAAVLVVGDAMLGMDLSFASDGDRRLAARARQYATKAVHTYQACLEGTIAPQTAAELSRIVRQKEER